MSGKKEASSGQGSGEGMTKYSVAPSDLSKEAQGVRADGHLVDCRGSPPLSADGVCTLCGAKVRR
jgi:hypothetical protein